MNQPDSKIWSKSFGVLHGILAFLLLWLGSWLIMKYFREFQIGYIAAPMGKTSDPLIFLPLGLSILGGFSFLHGVLNFIAMICIFLRKGFNFLIANAAMNLMIFPIGTYLGFQFRDCLKVKGPDHP